VLNELNNEFSYCSVDFSLHCKNVWTEVHTTVALQGEYTILFDQYHIDNKAYIFPKLK